MAIFIASCMAVAIFYCLFAAKTYKAEATLLPIGGNQGDPFSNTLAQQALGGLLLSSLGQVSPANPLLAALESRTLAEEVISELELKKFIYADRWNAQENKWDRDKEPTMEGAVKYLRKYIITVENDPELGTILIEVKISDPELAATIANQFIEELQVYLASTALTSAKRNRLFIERQLENNKFKLLQTGKELNEFYANNNVSSADPRVDVDVMIDGSLHERLVHDKYPKISDLQVKRDDLAQKVKQARLAKDIPQQVYLEYLISFYALLREVNVILTQEYEIAKISEAKDDIRFEVIDWARVPVKPIWPMTLLLLIVAFVSSTMLAIFIVIILEKLTYAYKRQQEANA